jgi:hypothetical protein
LQLHQLRLDTRLRADLFDIRQVTHDLHSIPIGTFADEDWVFA